jgi:hypothetical protein
VTDSKTPSHTGWVVKPLAYGSRKIEIATPDFCSD